MLVRPLEPARVGVLDLADVCAHHLGEVDERHSAVFDSPGAGCRRDQRACSLTPGNQGFSP